MNRSRPNTDELEDWIDRRNTQCNFDTILQVISMRSQPEVTRLPCKIVAEENKFGFLYELKEDSCCWKFEFDIHHASVFENGIMPLGALYKDCDGVPMIKCTGQNVETPSLLNVSEELRNIYFEVA